MAGSNTTSSSVLMGNNPTTYDKANPIVIFLIQATIVIIFCRILHFGLARLRQPRVIAEVIGGILLGPTAFGRIPNFTNSIFPSAAMPNFNLIANVGLILFLFIVGLEVDLRLIRKNARVALTVGAASLALPFAFGCLIAYLLHEQYSDTLKDDSFGVFLLFIGTAFSITAFPVLARILTELKLLRVDVGVTVLAAGVGNDVVGWILLALTIALVNSSSGLTALYVILLVIAWTLLLFLVVKPGYAWLARRTGMDNGPTDLMMTLTILLVLVSAFYTEIIGVHPIFGAFLVGLIVPHENNYAVNITEKIEDLVSVLFLPLYFASSGLKTNIGLLNDGKAWGYTIMIIVCATFSKIAGSMVVAKLNGFFWRESLTVGTLMSCKGLVELIVLNVGLSAGILSQKLFTMFVIMALVTTFMTTPLVMWFFPPWYQEKVARYRAGEIDWEGNRLEKSSDDGGSVHDIDSLNRMTIVVNRLEGASSLLRFTHFISHANVQLHLLRVMEMTDRLSQIIKVSESDDLLQQDSLLSIFKMMTRVVGVRLSYGLEVLASADFASAITNNARETKTDLVIAPWIQTNEGEWQDNEYISTLLEQKAVNMAILLDHRSYDDANPTLRRRTMSIGSILSRTRSDAEEIQQARNITRTLPSKMDAERVHIHFAIYKFGGDEKLGLLLLSQMLKNDSVSASVIFYRATDNDSEERKHSSNPSDSSINPAKVQFVVTEDRTLRPTMSQSFSNHNLQAPDLSTDSTDFETTSAALSAPNFTFEIVETMTPLQASIDRASVLSRSYATSTLTTMLTRSNDSFMRHQVAQLDRPSFTAASGSVRGDVAEIFASLSDRQGCGGGIIIVQAKQDSFNAEKIR